MIQIFNYRKWDALSGASIIPPRAATREFISRARGEIIETSVRLVEDRLVTDEGQEILQP